jgi:hypothetical protein
MATSPRDQDSSVEKDPGAGRSVDRAPRERRPGARRDRPRPLKERGRGGGPPSARSELRQRCRSGLRGRAPNRAIGEAQGGSRTWSARAGRGPNRAGQRLPARGEQAGDPPPSDRRSDTHRARAATAEGGTLRSADGLRSDDEPEHRTRWWAKSSKPWRRPRKRGGRQARSGPPEPHPPRRRGRVGAKPETGREVGQATNGRRGAGRGDAARLPTRRKPSQGGAPRGNRGAVRGAQARTTDLEETRRTPTRYRLQDAGSRERRKPSRWRETTRAERDRWDGPHRPKERLWLLWEWTFTGTSGEGPTARDEVPGEEGPRPPRGGVRAGSTRRERRRRGEGGRRRERSWRRLRRVPARETAEPPSAMTNGRAVGSERPTTDTRSGGGGRPRDLEHQPTPRAARVERRVDRVLREPLKERPPP